MQNTPALFVPLSLCFFSPSACHSISAVLLRVTAAIAGAVCGQTLPVVVKALTISRSDRPLFLSLSFGLPLIGLHREDRKVRQESMDAEKKFTNEGKTLDK